MNKLTIFLLFLALYSRGIAQDATGNVTRVDSADTPADILRKASHIVPSPIQMAALDREFIGFVHFGPNTFTRKEWGNGKEDPALFALQNLDTDQWIRSMQAAGMKMVIFTAKHHDGFVLWQSRYTNHGIMSSPFRSGKGDIMKELAASCKKYGMKLGIYLSPADLYQMESAEGLYGNGSTVRKRIVPTEVPGRPFANKTKFEFEIDDYNEYYLNQLFELLTEYGPISEVWLDGAHPRRKGGQTYDYTSWREMIRTLAPEAAIFGREDLRWCGNEAGDTRTSEWNVIGAYTDNPLQMTAFPDLLGDIASAGYLLSRERPYYLYYQPAEVDTSIRDGWFYRDEDTQTTRTADEIFDIYERAVGGNAILLLNVPPTREGVFSPRDVAVLEETGEKISQTYGRNIFDNADIRISETGATITLPEAREINRLLISEDIANSGERIESLALDALADEEWKEIATATNVGHKRIMRFPNVVSDRFRIRITSSRATPSISKISAHLYIP